MKPTPMSAPRYVEEWPDHMGLPDEDGVPAQSSLEQPQSNILYHSFEARLKEIHPDGNYFVSCDMGIYFDYTDPVLAGCRAPDWYYVPGSPALYQGTFRRSLVQWKEQLRPYLLIEYVGGDGSEERDRTPGKGKFWIYENAIGAGYYVIFDTWKKTLDAFCRQDDGYHPMSPNEAGRFLIEGLNLELGIWHGTYQNMTTTWLRAWNPTTGEMIQNYEERIKIDKERTRLAEIATQQAKKKITELAAELERLDKQIEEQRKRAEEQRQRHIILDARLRELGIDPDA